MTFDRKRVREAVALICDQFDRCDPCPLRECCDFAHGYAVNIDQAVASIAAYIEEARIHGD